jgi:hypothetical protein
MILRVGMPSSDQMPQQVMLPQFSPPQRDMAIDLMGFKIPAEMLGSPAFWCFFLLVIFAIILLGYFKYRAAK